MIVVVDYDMGNTGSVINMLSRIGYEAKLSGDPAVIRDAEKLILPGVGAFDKGMQNLQERGLIDALNEKVLLDKTPILGVCIAIQLFTQGSEEGRLPGLGWIRGEAKRFQVKEFDEELRIPHMGWNSVTTHKEHYIMNDLAPDSRYYFVHKYHVECENPNDILTMSHYGRKFVSSIARDNIVGCQFHPEKSLRWGMEIFRRFVNGVS